MEKTNQQYDKVISICRDLFSRKMTDYGTAWRILRPKSLTDQIYIKAQRIRSIEEKGVSKVDEGVIMGKDFNIKMIRQPAIKSQMNNNVD